MYISYLSRLFFGGHWCINIEAIWLIKESKQFDEITKAVTYLDGMLSGSRILRTVKVTHDQVSTLKSVIDHALGKEIMTTHHDYIYSAFHCFVQHKTEIYLNYQNMRTYNGEMLDVVMHPMEWNEGDTSHSHLSRAKQKREEGDFTNLFRSELLQIFHNVKILRINTYDNRYILSLLSLLSLIETTKVEKVILIGGPWISYSLRNAPPYAAFSFTQRKKWKPVKDSEVIQRYNQKGYDVFLVSHECECVIEKRL